jgi:hypothetical protein
MPRGETRGFADMIRFLVRWVFRLFILLLVCAVALILLKDVLAKALVEQQVRAQSGLDVNIGSLELGLFSPTLTIENLRVFNGAEFGGSRFLDVPDLHLEYDVGALAKRRLHLALLRLSLAEINVVEARDGRTNLVLALAYLEGGGSAPAGAAPTLFGLRFTGIDTLNLTLGKIRYASLRHPRETTEVTLGIRNEFYTNIRTIDDLRRLLTRALFRNGITISAASTQERRPSPSRGPP